MRHAGRLSCITLLSGLALGTAMFGLYMLAILWGGRWAYTELVAPICGSTVATALTLVVVAFISRRQRGIAAILRLAGLLTLGCFTLAAGLLFVTLANCSLACGNTIVAVSQSPSGRWKAVSFIRNCIAVARYCSPVSHVSVLTTGEGLPDETGNVFSTVGFSEVEWKSDKLLLVRYSGARVLRQEKRVRDVSVEYELFPPFL